MPINRALLDERIDYITAHPEEHRQDTWAVRQFDDYGDETFEWREAFEETEAPAPSCGTAFCLAGHVVNTIPGVKFDWSGEEGDALDVRLPGGDGGVSIPLQARQMLGLDRGQASALFAAYNTLDDIRALWDEFYAAEDEDRDWVDVREWV